MIIDAWIQFPNRQFLLDPMFEALRRWPCHWRILADEDPDIKPDDALSTMVTEGVSKVIASAFRGLNGPRITNEEIAAVVRRHPDGVVGIASVDLLHPMEGVRELRHCVKDYGFKGLRVLPWLWGLPPDDRRYYPLYAECVELGVVFCTQVGHAGPMRPSEPGRPIPYLDHVAHEFPDLVILGGHIGVPWVGEMISLMMKHPNVYVDTSGYKSSRYPRDLVDYMQGPGKRKVLFGSNFPMLTAAQCLEGLDQLGLSDETRALFLADNAIRVFKL